jgi:FkbM family methyltransferase
VAWGATLLADPTRTIGHSIWTTGVYDLAASEVLARLVRPGDTLLDAGANVGYMSLLGAVAAGPAGKVISFEPHPELFAILEKNLGTVNRGLALAATVLRNEALGAAPGRGELVLPPEMAGNDGVAFVARAGEAGGRTLPIRLSTIDEALGAESAAVLKLDVEGHEMEALRGAARALESRRIRHVLFEDHRGAGSEVCRLLGTAGYRVFSVGWSVWGPELAPAEEGGAARAWEAPNFLATLDAGSAVQSCAPRGWSVLRRIARR